MTDSSTVCDNRDLTITEIMTPDMANFGGNVHGGAILNAWIKQLMHALLVTVGVIVSHYHWITYSLSEQKSR